MTKRLGFDNKITCINMADDRYKVVKARVAAKEYTGISDYMRQASDLLEAQLPPAKVETPE